MFPAISTKYREQHPVKMEDISEAIDWITADSRDKFGDRTSQCRSVTSRAQSRGLTSQAQCGSVTSQDPCRSVTSRAQCGIVGSQTIHRQSTLWTPECRSRNKQLPVLISPETRLKLHTRNRVRFASPSHRETLQMDSFVDPFQGANIRLILAARHNELQDEYYELKEELRNCFRRGHTTLADKEAARHIHVELHSGISYFKKYLDTLNKDGRLKPMPSKENSFISKGNMASGSTKGSRSRFKLEYQRVKAEDLHCKSVLTMQKNETVDPFKDIPDDDELENNGNVVEASSSGDEDVESNGDIDLMRKCNSVCS
ncbi:uncharacterized protein LOC121372536 [Gigantopelta aegis]|uniref:uncharacterized protein LOC121372536 n=1 Tax=Gigantopelta aegis TaxID=1735272 RepID=UPI001B88CDE6|nr:uncharacterized protein LOC121372536 [Gigantopelta aegis]